MSPRLLLIYQGTRKSNSDLDPTKQDDPTQITYKEESYDGSAVPRIQIDTRLKVLPKIF